MTGVQTCALPISSTSFESELQSGVGAGQTIFEAHLLALLGHSAHNTPLQNITEGGQVIQRLTQNIAQKKAGSSFDVENLRADGYKVIEYANTKPNSDLLRIQSKKGIIDSPLCNTVRPN